MGVIRRIIDDIDAVVERDPAARNRLEVLICYPGIYALIMHRFEHFLYLHDLKFFARLSSQITRSLTGIEIHPGATIGQRCFIDHGMAVIIGETAELGDDCTLYQGVTLGGTGKDTGKRHPTLGNGVMVSSGAKVLGPFKVGDNVKIGAGAVVLEEIPPNCTVVGIPGKIVRMHGEKASELNQVDLPDPVSVELECLRKRIVELEKILHEMNGSASVGCCDDEANCTALSGGCVNGDRDCDDCAGGGKRNCSGIDLDWQLEGRR